jgi:hypothetical protein
MSDSYGQAASHDTLKKNPPLWVQLCFAAAGLGFDWHCAFEWFSKRYSLFSEPVLIRMGGIVVWCAAFSFLILLAVRRAKLRDTAAILRGLRRGMVLPDHNLDSPPERMA